MDPSNSRGESGIIPDDINRVCEEFAYQVVNNNGPDLNNVATANNNNNNQGRGVAVAAAVPAVEVIHIEDSDSSMDDNTLLSDLRAKVAFRRRVTDSDRSVAEEEDEEDRAAAAAASSNNQGHQMAGEHFQNDTKAAAYSHGNKEEKSVCNTMNHDGSVEPSVERNKTATSQTSSNNDELEESPAPDDSKMPPVERDGQRGITGSIGGNETGHSLTSLNNGGNEHSSENKKKRRRPKKTQKYRRQDDKKKGANEALTLEDDAEQEGTANKRTRTSATSSKSLTWSSSSRDTQAPKKKREPGTEIGSRVYAEFTDQYYYWGIITDIKRKKGSHYDQYSILFDDGDFLEYVSRRKFWTARQIIDSPLDNPPPVPNAHRKFVKTPKAAATSQKSKAAATMPQKSSMTLRELLRRSCGECLNCRKDDCGSCASCLSDPTKQVCIQKMCCKVSVEHKAQPMPPASRFPEGWKFVIDPTMDGYSKERAQRAQKIVAVDGLKIIPPGPGPGPSMEYYSAESAKGHCNIVLADASPEKFYAYIGAMSGSSGNGSSKSSGHEGKGCGSCGNCLKDSCGACARCVSSSGRGCFQKMCYKIPVEAKAEPAVGFPKGWRFYFAKAHVAVGSKYRAIPTLWILSPGGKPYRSAEAAFWGGKGSCRAVDIRMFYKHVGLSAVAESRPAPEREESGYDSDVDSCEEPMGASSAADEIGTTTDNFLVGRKMRFDWTDANRERKVAYGQITKCEYDAETGDVIRCDVLFSKQSQELVNVENNSCGLYVPESQTMRAELAVGCCMRFEKESRSTMARLSDYVELPFHFKWITPDFRREALVEADGQSLPRLQLACRGFRLVFTVEASRIPNAGYGVFVSCTPLHADTSDSDDSVDHQEPFELNAGELLDLGVYAPLRMEDKKSGSAFYVKNFIHSFKCEEWAFDASHGDNTDAFQLDITDEATGELHDIAKKHIHAYVNESNDDEDITVTAVHDPEGTVHYLFGHGTESQGKFVLPSDGRKKELYINYGKQYEKVRVRKGYGFFPEDEAEMLEELDDEDVSVIVEIGRFGVADIEAAVGYLCGVFQVEDQSTFRSASIVIQRALTCAVVLHRRAHRIFWEANEDDTELSSTASMQKVLKLSSRLVSRLLNMTNDERSELKILHASNNVEELLMNVLERQQYSEAQLNKMRAELSCL